MANELGPSTEESKHRLLGAIDFYTSLIAGASDSEARKRQQEAFASFIQGTYGPSSKATALPEAAFSIPTPATFTAPEVSATPSTETMETTSATIAPISPTAETSGNAFATIATAVPSQEAAPGITVAGAGPVISADTLTAAAGLSASLEAPAAPPLPTSNGLPSAPPPPTAETPGVIPAAPVSAPAAGM